MRANKPWECLRHCCAVFLFLAFITKAAGLDVAISPPSGDRWHYPYNGTPGTRLSMSLFSQHPSIPDPEFNYRDGMAYLRFATAGAVQSGQTPGNYQFTAVRVVIWHATGNYTWDTRAGDLLEIFGMGNDDEATSNVFTRATWQETSPYFGGFQGGGAPALPRNPFPLNIDETTMTQHVEDLVGAQAWGFGEPIYGSAAGQYLPNTTIGTRFPITFTLDLNNARVRRYIQDELSSGTMSWVVSSPVQAAGPTSVGYPQLVTKEALFATFAPTLEIDGLTTGTPQADLLVETTVSPAFVEPAANAEILITVTNIGWTTATAVTLSSAFSNGVDFTSSTLGTIDGNGNLNASLGNLGMLDSVQFSATAFLPGIIPQLTLTTAANTAATESELNNNMAVMFLNFAPPTAVRHWQLYAN